MFVVHLLNHSLEKHLLKFMLGTKETDKKTGFLLPRSCLAYWWNFPVPHVALGHANIRFLDFCSRFFHLEKEASLLFTEAAIQAGGGARAPGRHLSHSCRPCVVTDCSPSLKQRANHFLVLLLKLHGNALPRKGENSCITSVCAWTLTSWWAGM